MEYLSLGKIKQYASHLSLMVHTFLKMQTWSSVPLILGKPISTLKTHSSLEFYVSGEDSSLSWLAKFEPTNFGS